MLYQLCNDYNLRLRSYTHMLSRGVNLPHTVPYFDHLQVSRVQVARGNATALMY